MHLRPVPSLPVDSYLLPVRGRRRGCGHQALRTVPSTSCVLHGPLGLWCLQELFTLTLLPAADRVPQVRGCDQNTAQRRRREEARSVKSSAQVRQRSTWSAACGAWAALPASQAGAILCKMKSAGAPCVVLGTGGAGGRGEPAPQRGPWTLLCIILSEELSLSPHPLKSVARKWGAPVIVSTTKTFFKG